MANSFLIFRVLDTFIGLLGVLGNGLVILVIYRVRSMHTLTMAFICHQSVIDFLGSVLLVLKSNLPDPASLPDTVGGEVLCRLWIGDALLYLVFVTSSFNLMALTLERYIAILHPLRFRWMFTRKGTAGVMAVTWLVGLAIKSYSFSIYAVVDGQCITVSQPESRVMGPLIICLQYIVPAVIMLFCYTRIAVTLGKTASPVVEEAEDAGSHHQPAAAALAQQQQQQQHQQQQQQLGQQYQQYSLLRDRRDIIQTLIIVFVTFLVCWTPSQVAFFMFNMGWLELSDLLRPILVSFVALNCCLNPIIYSFKYKLFRRALRKMIGRHEEQHDGLLPPTAVTQMTDHYRMCSLEHR